MHDDSRSAPGRRTLYRDGALVDGRSDRLQVGICVLFERDLIAWSRPSDDEDPGPTDDLEVVDAGRATIVARMVDGHGPLTMPGRSHWIARGGDPPDTAVATAAGNVAWAAGPVGVQD